MLSRYEIQRQRNEEFFARERERFRNEISRSQKLQKRKPIMKKSIAVRIGDGLCR